MMREIEVLDLTVVVLPVHLQVNCKIVMINVRHQKADDLECIQREGGSLERFLVGLIIRSTRSTRAP
jgi:hypothetical protein